jgi:hypothetical protein
MDQAREDQHWEPGQHVRMTAEDSIVPMGVRGVVRRVYTDLDTLIVQFEDAPDVCLVGGEEIEALVASDDTVLRERGVGEPLY